VSQVVERLLCKPKALSSNSDPIKKKEKRKITVWKEVKSTVL
jgi:hypothetical protein